MGILKIIGIAGIYFLAFNSAFSQPAGQKFATGGNLLSNGDFLGSTNYQPLIIKTNNTEWLCITPTGNVGVGTSIPGSGYKMDISGRTHGYGFYADSTMMALEVRAQLLRAGYILADSAGMSKIVSDIIHAATLYGIDIYASRIDVIRLSVDTITSSTGTIQFGSNNLNTSGTIDAGTISSSALQVSGTTTLHSVVLNDGITIMPFIGTGEGLLKFNNTGGINRLNFTSDSNDVLTGSGIFRNISALVPPDTGWQWYDTTVLLSTAPVVAIQNNLVVGGRVSIGSLRMSNGSATDTMTTDRRFALEAAKIFLRADTVHIEDYASARQITADTLTMNKYAKVGSDTSKYNPPLTGTLALEVAGSATVKGDIAVKGSIASSAIATNDLTISSTISSPKVITSRITSPDSVIHFGDSTITINYGQNLVYSNNYLKIFSPKKVLELQTIGSQNIFMSAANNSLVGIGTWQPQKKLHIFTQHGTGGGGGQGSSHQGIRLENLVDYDNSVWDIEPIVDNGIKFTLGTPSKEIFTLTNYGYAGLNTLSPKYDFQIHSDSMVNWSSYVSPFGGVDPPPPGLPVQVGLAMMQITNASTDATSGDGLLLGTFRKEAFLVNQENGPMKFATNDLTRMTITEMGDIGIGTKTPQAKLDVNGNALFAGYVGIGTTNPGTKLHVENNGNVRITLKDASNPTGRYFQIEQDGDLVSFNDDGVKQIISMDLTSGNVGIGTTSPQAKLHVEVTANSDHALSVYNGNIKNFTILGSGEVFARKFKSTLASLPDYVFEKDFKYMTITELEEYIQKFKHLPGFKSAKEYEREGNVVDFNELIKQIYEQMEIYGLYFIELKKENETLKKELELANEKLNKR